LAGHVASGRSHESSYLLPTSFLAQVRLAN
jgi:hypothetical protein